MASWYSNPFSDPAFFDPKHRPEYRDNPAWTNHALLRQWDEILRFAGPARVPKITKHTAKQLTAVEYGTGHYGTVLPTLTKGLVVKITSDPTEAKFVQAAFSLKPWPAGLIRYHAAFKLKGTFRNRPMYILWRDEAFEIGEWAKKETRSIQKFVSRLYTYYLFANGIGSVFWKSKGLHALRKRSYAALGQNEFYPTKSTLEKITLDARSLVSYTSYPKSLLIPAIRSLEGPQRVAFCIRGAFLTAQFMAQEPIGSFVGQTFSELLDKGIVMADVHKNNIGKAGRRLTITDPGHAIFLIDRYDKLEPAPIAKATKRGWHP